MKVAEIIHDDIIEERKALRNALAAGVLGVSAMSPKVTASADVPPEPPAIQREQPPQDEIVAYGRRSDLPRVDVKANIEQPNITLRKSELTNSIAKRYRVDKDLVRQVVDLAFKYEDQQFPKAEDILAVTGVESSFNPNSVSGLRRDPAIGLMQVRPGVWNIDREHLDSVENQIRFGSKILQMYYNKLGNAEDALQAYNLGITRFRRGDRTPQYVAKVDHVRTTWAD